MAEDLIRRLEELVSKYDFMFSDFVEKYKTEFPKSTLILFGSRGRGTNRPSSDFDLLAIFERVEDRFLLASKILSLSPFLPIDIIVITKDELKERIIMQMLKEGCKSVYDGLSLNLCK
ncbi:nucleotidyltransferase domain-containing protein [Acidianus sp. RZ1]|uniref:nucleotidyltransferase domain-containing protein n=1 Tax=Acidianus sp. RZ1 TaxID=1540082 RepID=UPI001491053E|nr:nucleotidyltransferase domain-containing protein [Acidianus sp. RZ1]NON63358.1 nucleotidyltransferase domain-containing protein [Acidianus sp. RZ1]